MAGRVTTELVDGNGFYFSRAAAGGRWVFLAGVAVAAVGTAVAGLGVAQTATFLAISSLLLYAGFTISSGKRASSLPG